MIILLVFISLTLYELQSQNNNSRFPEYNKMIESCKAVSDMTNELEKDYNIDENLSKIEFIDIIKLKDILSKFNEKNTLIHIWSTTLYEASDSQIEKISKFKDSLNYNIILICTDISTKKQINLARKYLFKKGFFQDSYIIYQNFSSMNDVIANLKNPTQAKIFLKNLDYEYNDSLPYTLIVNKQNKIIYRKEGSIEFNNNYIIDDSISQNNIISDYKFISIFADDKDTNSQQVPIVQNINADLTIKGNLTEDIGSDYEISDNLCNIIPIDKLGFDSLLMVTPRKKLIIHFWGSWCSGQSLGIKDIIDIIPNDSTYKLYLIATDIYTKEQMKLIRYFLYQNKIFTDSYIIKNKNGKFETVDEFSTEKPLQVTEFISLFDSSYYHQPSMPYTAVINENGNILYRRHPVLEAKRMFNMSIDNLNSNQSEELMNAFQNLEVKKIKEILK
jgi:thiol-disulfide isomerase/thioredoxin